MFHWSGSSVWWSCISSFVWGNFVMTCWNLCIENLLFGIWSVSQKRWSNKISQHSLSIEFKFKRLPLIDDRIYSSAQILWFKMCTCIWTLILLSSIIVGVDSFVIVKINILCVFIIFLCFLLFFFFIIILYFVLIILLIWKLINIIFFLSFTVLLVVLAILSTWHLLSMDSSVLLNFHRFFNYSIILIKLLNLKL